MNNKPIAIIDVDLTVVDTASSWLHWLNSLTGRNETFQSLNNSYDLGAAFKEDLAKFNLCPYDYWRNAGIYDTLYPKDGAYRCLKLLKDIGYDIVFVTHTKGSHSKSKYNFLRRHFGDIMSGYVATKEKHFVSSGTGRDIIVDDRHKFINAQKAKHKFVFGTPFTQDEALFFDGSCNLWHYIPCWDTIRSIVENNIGDFY